jgi:hypothetical protein
MELSAGHMKETEKAVAMFLEPFDQRERTTWRGCKGDHVIERMVHVAMKGLDVGRRDCVLFEGFG